jgi:hypothetical protein
MENKLTQKKVEVMGITIHFKTEETQEGYAENCTVKYSDGIAIDNMATVYKSIKDFYDGLFFENIKE